MSEAIDHDQAEEPDEPICPATGAYCTGQFCDDYGCAKQHGFYDDDDD